MKELRREFLRESVSGLETLLEKFAAPENAALPEPLRRELFRRLHTIKGTSQAFDLEACAALAHTIESLLQSANASSSDSARKYKELILEGVEILLDDFRRLETDRETISRRAFLDKISDFLPNAPSAENRAGAILKNIPANLLAVLSNYEIGRLAKAIESGGVFYSIAAFFEFAEFDERFKKLNGVLNENGEVVAAAPAPNSPPGAIGFRFFYAARIPYETVAALIEDFRAEVLFPEKTADGGTNRVREVLNQAARAGSQAARALGREVDFEIEAAEIPVSAKRLKLLFEASLHLIRNAVDHAVEPPEERIEAGKSARGRIKLSVEAETNDLILRVSDDGRGIDAEKVRRKAVAQNLVAPDADTSEAEITRLIFAHGFSTSETVSEISGRGVGLDAVKDAAEKAGGSISVASRKGSGTIFEIRLPKDDETESGADAK